MTGDDGRAGAEYDQPRVPRPLRDRVDDLFVAARGYEPASFQEALSVVAELAADSMASGGDATGTSQPGPGEATRAGAVSSDATSGGSPGLTGDGSSDRDAASDAAADPDGASPADASLDADADGSVSFDDYVEGLAESSQGPSPGVESMLDTEHADGVVRELAAEVLDEMTQDAFQELEHGVDQGVGAGVTDGMGATQTVDGSGTAPSGSKGDGVPDSLTADPESDCAVCGRAHPVSVLQTTILEEDGSVTLVCPSCAE